MQLIVGADEPHEPLGADPGGVGVEPAHGSPGPVNHVEGSVRDCLARLLVDPCRRPVPVEEKLILRGELTEEDERDFHVAGAILDSKGTELTTAVARLRKVRQT